MTSDTRERSRLTPKGERTRARIIDAAARLIYQRGVAGTTLEDIKATAEVSGSQLRSPASSLRAIPRRAP
jgi:AcrR family transcriptional regulator